MRSPGAGVGQRIHMAAQHALQRLGAALVGNMAELDAGCSRKLLHAHMGGAAHASVGVGDAAGLGLGSGDEVLQGLEARVGRYGDAEGLARGTRDIGVVLARIGLQRAKLGEARDRDRDLADGVAVGLGRGQGLGADHARGSGAVFDCNRLAQDAAGHGAQRAHGLVGRAAGRPGADEGDGALGPGLGQQAGGTAERGCAEGAEHKTASAVAWGDHRLSPVVI